jgi:hypothetical protein
MSKASKNVGERTFGQRTILSTNTKLISMILVYLGRIGVGSSLGNPKVVNVNMVFMWLTKCQVDELSS